MAERVETRPELTSDEKKSVGGDVIDVRDGHGHGHEIAILNQDYEGKPTDEEFAALRRVPGRIPTVAYLLCAVEFCERASFLGCAQIWTNYINRPLPKGGNGYGAVAPGSTSGIQGALGMGEQIANATTQSFSLIAFCLPLAAGYLADSKFGRYPMIFWGVVICGIGHILIVAGGAKELIDNGTAKIPFFLGVYVLAVGAAMFKPNVTPLLLDQMRSHVPKIRMLRSGERVIEDPEHGTERVMLWFYIVTNIGGFMSTATSYSAKYVGWWLAFLLPLILYLPLPLLLVWLKPRLILRNPGGSDLPNVFRAVGHCLAGRGILRIGRKGWWDNAKPSVRARRGLSLETHYSDDFVADVQRTMQATGMFCFFPVQYWNDNGIGSSANFLSTMLTSDGVPNDVVGNFNCLSIIVLGPVLNYVLYPMLRKAKIPYGPVARVTTGFFISTLAGIGYTVLCYKAYQTSPCGWYGSTDPRCVENELFSPISLWWQAVPFALGGFSELFINVPAYGIAYSRAPVNMRGLVSAINLFSTGFAYIVNLATSAVIVDPYLVWDFGGPAIVGGVVTVFFWFTFKHIDEEKYVLSTTQTSEVAGVVVVEDTEAAPQHRI
ncbi:hypothetical protein EsDP_00001790 [Epichloe bromicola]|uniref:Uncharacterized protein n=1 Tax=Epichloe bromicola TaxID=79588 RepID=A0ABQ0CIW6_9HYPO